MCFIYIYTHTLLKEVLHFLTYFSMEKNPFDKARLSNHTAKTSSTYSMQLLN